MYTMARAVFLSASLLKTRGSLPLVMSRAIHASTTKFDQPRSRFLPSLSLQDKVCVVTGGARGLGNTFAEAFLESGCSKLAILDLNEEHASAAGIALVQQIEAAGTAAKGEIETVGYGLDVSNEQSVVNTIKSIVDKWGRIDSLVTAAGIVHNFPALEYPTDKMKRLYEINVYGSYFCAREVAKEMIKTKTNGSITLIASMSGSIVNYPQPQAPYNASKAAVIQLAKSLAVEWAEHGIRVNSLSPGYMRTPLVADVLRNAENNLESTWIERTPLRRLGNPEDLKGPIVLLASDAAKFITGTDFIVDGGYTAY